MSPFEAPLHAHQFYGNLKITFLGIFGQPKNDTFDENLNLKSRALVIIINYCSWIGILKRFFICFLLTGILLLRANRQLFMYRLAVIESRVHIASYL